MGTVHAFDPRPARPVRVAPFFLGLGWAFLFISAFWSGVYLITQAFYG